MPLEHDDRWMLADLPHGQAETLLSERLKRLPTLRFQSIVLISTFHIESNNNLGSSTMKRERDSLQVPHSLWEHSSHFRLIGRGVPSMSVVSQLMYKFLCLASPKENP